MKCKTHRWRVLVSLKWASKWMKTNYEIKNYTKRKGFHINLLAQFFTVCVSQDSLLSRMLKRGIFTVSTLGFVVVIHHHSELPSYCPVSDSHCPKTPISLSSSSKYEKLKHFSSSSTPKNQNNDTKKIVRVDKNLWPPIIFLPVSVYWWWRSLWFPRWRITWTSSFEHEKSSFHWDFFG